MWSSVEATSRRIAFSFYNNEVYRQFGLRRAVTLAGTFRWACSRPTRIRSCVYRSSPIS